MAKGKGGNRVRVGWLDQDAEARKGDDKRPRKLSRPARRTQLIEATISVLSQRGLTKTTLTEVAAQAGLSHGLVNFHFQSKEGLLNEVLLYLSEEYRENWESALAAAPDDPASQLDALIRADFNEAICTPDRLSAWCSFWGEAQSRPVYKDKCGTNDDEYNALMERICAALVTSRKIASEPVFVARVIRVTIEGVWLDMMTMNEPYSRAEARRTVFTCAAAFFPQDFTVDGLIAR